MAGKRAGVAAVTGIVVSVGVGLVFGVWPAMKRRSSILLKRCATSSAANSFLIQFQALKLLHQSRSFCSSGRAFRGGRRSGGPGDIQGELAADEQLGMAIDVDGQVLAPSERIFRQTFFFQAQALIRFVKGPHGIDVVRLEGALEMDGFARRGLRQFCGEKQFAICKDGQSAFGDCRSNFDLEGRSESCLGRRFSAGDGDAMKLETKSLESPVNCWTASFWRQQALPGEGSAG